MDKTQIERYLERIGVQYPASPSYRFLSRLYTRHLHSVPFENVDVYCRLPIFLDERYFYEEVVDHKTGGWCFELNGLFFVLLNELGFDVRMIGGEVYCSGGTPCYPCSHMLIVVTVDRPYLLDVGYGDCFREPFPLDGNGRLDDGFSIYSLTHNKNTDTYVLSRQDRKDSSTYRILYQFTMKTRTIEEFLPGFGFMVANERGHLRARFQCNRLGPRGRVTLLNNELKRVTQNGMTIERIETCDDAISFLKDEMGFSASKCRRLEDNTKFRKLFA